MVIHRIFCRLKKLLEDLVDGYLFDSLCCCELSKISDIQDISSLASCNCFSGKNTCPHSVSTIFLTVKMWQSVVEQQSSLKFYNTC